MALKSLRGRIEFNVTAARFAIMRTRSHHSSARAILTLLTHIILPLPIYLPSKITIADFCPFVLDSIASYR